MKKVRDIGEIRDALEANARRSCKPSFEKIREGTVIDEEKSVRWNREYVEKNNADYAAEASRLNTEKNKEYAALMDEMYEAIIDYSSHIKTRKAAEKVWSEAWERGHSCGYCDVISYLFDILWLLDEVAKANEVDDTKGKDKK